MNENLDNKLDPILILIDKINEIVDKSEKKSLEYSESIENDINDLSLVYEEFKALLNEIKRHKTSFKSLSELYSCLLSYKKEIIGLKEKKYKTSEQDIKLIKSLLDSISKASSLDKNSIENSDNGSFDVSQIIKGL